MNQYLLFNNSTHVFHNVSVVLFIYIFNKYINILLNEVTKYCFTMND